MRLLTVVSNGYGSAYYRQVLPFQALQRAGYTATILVDSSLPENILKPGDVVQISRVSRFPGPIIERIKLLQARDTKIVLDYDDDLLNIPGHNHARKRVDPDAVIAALQAADGVVVSNEALAAVYRPYARKIAVIPNYVDAGAWPSPPSRKEGLTIGLVGSASHCEDWKLVIEPMRRIRQEFPGVKFLVAGYLPEYFQAIATEVKPWSSVELYQHTVNRIDIGLAPLLDDDFNRRKSPSKAYEYALAGAAVVGSPTQYRTVLQGRGVVAHTEDDWYNGIATYITNEHKRRADAQALQGFVKKTLDVNKHAHEIYSIYKNISKGK